MREKFITKKLRMMEWFNCFVVGSTFNRIHSDWDRWFRLSHGSLSCLSLPVFGGKRVLMGWAEAESRTLPMYMFSCSLCSLNYLPTDNLIINCFWSSLHSCSHYGHQLLGHIVTLRSNTCQRPTKQQVKWWKTFTGWWVPSFRMIRYQEDTRGNQAVDFST